MTSRSSPLGIVKAGRLYQDGVDIRIEDIAAHVDAGGEITTTNAVNIADYEDVFRRMTQRYDAVIHFNIGMQFSSCYQNAKLAAEEVPEVHVVDSANLTVGHGILVLAAAEAAESGKSVSEIFEPCGGADPPSGDQLRPGPAGLYEKGRALFRRHRSGRQPSQAPSLRGGHRWQDVRDQEVPGLHGEGGGGTMSGERLAGRTDIDTRRVFPCGTPAARRV